MPPEADPGARYPGRPSPQTCVASLCNALALLLLDRRGARLPRPAELLAAIAALISTAALLGYLFGVAALYGPLSLLPHTGLSIPTAASTLAIASGVVAARAGDGALAVLTRDDPGGIAARQLVSWFFWLVPLVLAVALGSRLGLYPPPVAAALVVLVGLVAGSAFVIRTSSRLSQLDSLRREGEETRARLASLVESADDAIVAKSPDGTIQHWNPAAERIYGFRREEILGRSIFELVPPDRREELERILEEVRGGGAVRSFETERLRKDGSRVPLAVTISPIVDARGRLVGTSTIAHDISARKRAEEALRAARETERRLRKELEDVSRAAVAVADAVADLPETDVSAVLSTIALQAQLLAHAPFVAVGIAAEADRPYQPWVAVGLDPEEARAAFLRGGAGTALGSVLEVPIRRRARPVGKVFLGRPPGAPPFTEQDERRVRMLSARVGAAIETATLYAAENLQRSWLQSTIDQMPDPVLLHEPSGRLQAMNQAAAALGCDAAGRVDPFGNPLPIDLRRADGAVLAEEEWPAVRALRHRRATFREELLVRRRDGASTPVSASAAPVYDAGGAIVGAMVMLQDVSAEKELARLRDEWNAIIAHDLRQPVTTIALSAQSLRKFHGADLTAPEKRIVERIDGSARRLKRMIDDLLDASRIESHRLSVEPREVDLGTVVDAVTTELADALAGRDLEVRVEPDELVHADPDRLHQVLGNLLLNAAKYGTEGTPILVAAEPRDDLVEVTVTNRGPGIPPEDLDLLFRRFYRTRHAREARLPGLGLGLYIAQGLVEAHGGTMWAESTPGETTTFHFTVPRARPPPSYAEEAAAHAGA